MAAALLVIRAHVLGQSREVLLKSGKLLVRTPMINQSKGLASNARSAFRRSNVIARSPTLKERLLAPQKGTAFDLGRGLLLGASAFGVGALCYYGAGLSSEPGAIDKSVMWPNYVKDRIKATYAYFGGSIAITAASAFAVSQSPKLMSLMMKNSWLAIGATFAAMIGSGMVVRSIPYSEGLGGKQLAWMVHSGIMGAVVAPLCLLGGPILMRAAWYTAGVVGGSMFFPPTTALGAGLYSISMYGGLVLFGAFLLYDTQRIVRMAETYPVYAIKPYDPINA